MIKVWTDEKIISAEFKGKGTDLINEMGYVIKNFANEVLEIDVIDFLWAFIETYQKTAKAEASNETDVH